MIKSILISSVEKKIKNIKSRYKKKYGAVFFDVKVKSFNDFIILEGAVLSEKQKNEVFVTVKEIIKNNRVKNSIRVLSDPKDDLEIGWGIITADVADMRVKLSDKKNTTGESPASNKSSLGGLASQAMKGDFVRILLKEGIWYLAQTRDLTIGWVDSSRIALSKWEIIKKEWIKTKRVRAGEVVRKRLAKNIQSKFLRFLEKYLNAQYLLGGMTGQSIDCSGLTQKFYSDIFGILLPRHSSDQALCGEKIELSAAHFGDLVFLRRKATKVAHIGIVVEKFKTPKAKRQTSNSILILNARREIGGVAIEDLPDILKFYNLISVRRIIKQVLIKK
ncbi:MAG: NlpC/P60 family protein [bacterium]|nr:NlpC/P60 family protein [bacterium]